MYIHIKEYVCVYIYMYVYMCKYIYIHVYLYVGQSSINIGPGDPLPLCEITRGYKVVVAGPSTKAAAVLSARGARQKQVRGPGLRMGPLWQL